MTSVKPKLSKTYFKENHIMETFLILGFIFGFLPLISFRCDLFPMDWVPSQVGHLVSYLCEHHQNIIRNTFLITLVIHLIEAVLAIMLCNYMDYEGPTTMKWGINVFIHGLFSLRHLISELVRYEDSKPADASPEIKMGLANYAH